MKILPIVLVLLLAVEMKPRFLLSFAGFVALFLALPFLTDVAHMEAYYRSWWKMLTMDNGLVFTERWVHFFCGIKPFLEANFGIIPDWKIDFLLPLLFGAAIGLWTFLKLRPFTDAAFGTLLCVALTFMLLFNPRTEGPTLVLLGPVYGLIYRGIARGGFGAQTRAILCALFGAVFFTTSLSTTDIGRALRINEFFWNANLRTVGIVVLFGASLVCLVSKRVRMRLMGGA